eukprot:COSAG06_NODE_32582_length_503_cov_1.868812_2_plen_27_part_01
MQRNALHIYITQYVYRNAQVRACYRVR